MSTQASIATWPTVFKQCGSLGGEGSLGFATESVEV